ncbi:MAG: hypothetical protein H6700_06545 [Myxococcales bacterium]|nr:hypothetical protein [Myxococcales bacterium]
MEGAVKIALMLAWVGYHLFRQYRRSTNNAIAASPRAAKVAPAGLAPTPHASRSALAQLRSRLQRDVEVGAEVRTDAATLVGEARLLRARLASVERPGEALVDAFDAHIGAAVPLLELLGGEAQVTPDAIRLIGLTRSRVDALRVLADARLVPSTNDTFAAIEELYAAIAAPLHDLAESGEITYPRYPLMAAPVTAAEALSGMLRDRIVLPVDPDLPSDPRKWADAAWAATIAAARACPGLIDELHAAARAGLAAAGADRAESPVESALVGLWIPQLVQQWLTVIVGGPAMVSVMLERAAVDETPQPWTLSPSAPPPAVSAAIATELLYDVGHAHDANALERSAEHRARLPDEARVHVRSGAVVAVSVRTIVELAAATASAVYATALYSLGGRTLEEVPGYELSPGVWAGTQRVVDALRRGDVAEQGGASTPVPHHVRGAWMAAVMVGVARPASAGPIFRGARSFMIRGWSGLRAGRTRRSGAKLDRADLRLGLVLPDLAARRRCGVDPRSAGSTAALTRSARTH